MSKKLKPCPFCGNTHLFCEKGELGIDEIGDYFIICNFCHTTGPAGFTEAKAIEAWNRRVHDDA